MRLELSQRRARPFRSVEDQKEFLSAASLDRLEFSAPELLLAQQFRVRPTRVPRWRVFPRWPAQSLPAGARSLATVPLPCQTVLYLRSRPARSGSPAAAHLDHAIDRPGHAWSGIVREPCCRAMERA